MAKYPYLSADSPLVLSSVTTCLQILNCGFAVLCPPWCILSLRPAKQLMARATESRLECHAEEAVKAIPRSRRVYWL